MLDTNDLPANIAPAVREIFEQTAAKKGFVPNVLSIYGQRPELVGGIAQLSNAFGAGELTDAEREIVYLTTSVANKCRYCVAGHTYYGLKAGIDAGDLDKIRRSESLEDPRFDALRMFSRVLAMNRGRGADLELEQFHSVGYSQSQTLDVIVGVAAKTLSNMTASLLNLPLDRAFEPYVWTPESSLLTYPE